MTVRSAAPADRAAIAAFLEARGMRHVARLGELLDALEDSAIVAQIADGTLSGVLTYRVVGRACEVTTLYVEVPGRGTGTDLLAAVEAVARAEDCQRLWLITTNDNVDALRFYQRRDFRITAVHPGAVDRSRASLKPSIPLLGDHDVPIRDELVLEKTL